MLKKINKEENIGPLNLWSGTLKARPFNLSDHVEETLLCQFIKFFKQGLHGRQKNEALRKVTGAFNSNLTTRTKKTLLTNVIGLPIPLTSVKEDTASHIIHKLNTQMI